MRRRILNARMIAAVLALMWLTPGAFSESWINHKHERKVVDASEPAAEPEQQPDAIAVEDDTDEAQSPYSDLFEDDPLLAEESGQINDPLKGWNVVWYQFNDKTYYWLLKPTATGYKFLLPQPARHGVKNFFINLEMPVRFFNSLFQGRANQAGDELGRFLVNSTVGVLGFMDPATHWLEMDIHHRDMDQTLAKAGAEKGVYLVWPIIGPSSVRGTVGWVSDTVMDPATYLPGAGIIQTINTISLGEFGYEDVVEASIDPYAAIRSGYVQYRDSKAKK